MTELIQIDQTLHERFPLLSAQITRFTGVNVQRKNPDLEEYKNQVYAEIKTRWNIEELREDPQFRAYRDFFWKLGIDPTKNRPAAEALIRRVLRDRPIPNISTWVDSYNLVSMNTAIPIASFDSDLLEGPLLMREARQGEEFLGIGMKKPVVLEGGEVVIEDGERLVAIYPYRDADHSKVTFSTSSVLLLMCGAPGITVEELEAASSMAVNVLTRYCGGSVN